MNKSTKLKGDILESITEILEKSISDESSVITKKKKIKDLDGIVREIDIYIENIYNKRKFTIAIECKNYKDTSRIDIDQIGAFYEKCSRLPFISKMIFLTTSDYQKGAIEKARTRNIELYRISSEPVATDNELGVKKISIINKECKIIGIRLNSDKLIQNRVPVSKKLHFYSAEKNLIYQEDFHKIITELPDIWRFLYTKSGLLLNYKKIIYPTLKTKNLFTKYKEEYYPVESMQIKLEIEYALNPLPLDTIKSYKSITEDIALAIFSDLEFVKNGVKHRLCYVKPSEEIEGRIYISVANKTPVELKTLGKLKDGPKPLSEINLRLRNVQIKPYEFDMDKQAFDNAISNNQVAPKAENSNFLKDLNRKETSILVGLQEQKLFFMIPFSHNKKLITAKFPEPISLYFNHSIELYKKSVGYKNTVVEDVPDGEFILLQDDSYHKFLQYSISSILMIYSAVEIFINSHIKDNVKIEINGTLLNKKELEKALTLSQKLEKVVPSICNFNLTLNKRIVKTIFELDELNDELQNLKTSDSINQPFLDTFEKLLKFDLEYCFKSVKSFFSKVDKNFKLDEM